MKKYFIVFIFSLLAIGNSMAQAPNYQKEINEQVWLPFIESYGSNNSEAFMALHSKDLVRVTVDNKVIQLFDSYKYSTERGNSNRKNLNIKPSIEFRFVQRIANDQAAYEVGYYKVTSNEPTGVSYFYGKFTVVLRKESGKWKITLDSDSSEGITESVFNSGQKM